MHVYEPRRTSLHLHWKRLFMPDWLALMHNLTECQLQQHYDARTHTHTRGGVTFSSLNLKLTDTASLHRAPYFMLAPPAAQGHVN